MIYRVRDRAFGKSFWFSRTTPEQEMELEDLGLKLVPDLISGKYQAAFAGWGCSDQPDRKCVPNYLASRLEGYRVPPWEERGLLPPELVEQASLPLTKYVPARYPSIAASARVSGDVRLSIAADPQTGAVTSVEVVDGSPLLSQAAVEAAQSWQFAPAFLTGQPLEATLRFQLRCRGE
jgi:TonB family protein